jgi:hypothetical protein
VSIAEPNIWGQLEFPAVNELAAGRDAAGWLTPSAAIDACFYTCGVYAWVCGGQGVTVPDTLGRIMFGRAAKPLERATAFVECREMQDKHGVFDFTLFGDDGAVIFQANNYRCHILKAK